MILPCGLETQLVLAPSVPREVSDQKLGHRGVERAEVLRDGDFADLIPRGTRRIFRLRGGLDLRGFRSTTGHEKTIQRDSPLYGSHNQWVSIRSETMRR